MSAPDFRAVTVVTVVTGYGDHADYPAAITSAADAHKLPGVTITHGTGYAAPWGTEPVVKVETYLTRPQRKDANEIGAAFAESLRIAFAQDAVVLIVDDLAAMAMVTKAADEAGSGVPTA